MAPEFQPTIVTHCGDAAMVLARRRHDLGLTGEELDARAGLPDRYTGKFERPLTDWGKRGLQISAMYDLLLQTLGLRLLIVTAEQAAALGAQPMAGGPPKPLRQQPVIRPPARLVVRRTYRRAA